MRKVINFDKYSRKNTEDEIKEFEDLIKQYKETGKISDRMDLRHIYVNKMKYYQKKMEIDSRYYHRKKSDYGMGFLYVKHEFYNSKIIKDYMAENMFNDIYYGVGSMEEKLHKEFNGKKGLKKLIEKEPKGYFLDLVSEYDEYLSRYLEKHPELLKSKEDNINEFIERWKEYDTDRIVGQIIEFIDYHDDCDFELHDMAIYLKYKLGIDIMDIYKENKEKAEEEEFFDNKEYYKSFFGNLSQKEKIMLEDFEIIMNNFMKGKDMPDSYDFDIYLEEERKKKEKTKTKRKSKKRKKDDE